MPLLAPVLALVLGPGATAAEDGPRFAPPPVELGADLREDWNDLWRRFQDRNGRPDVQGPLLQPSPQLQYPEYELTLAVARHPLGLEADWNRRSRGARLWVHSDTEFRFINEWRIKERIPMGRAAALGLRFDRRELRGVNSAMLRLDFAFPNIAGSGAFIELRPIARLEKPDLDGELVVGWARPQVARVAARLLVFDPVNNATDALAQGRDSPQELRTIQRGPSFGASAELDLDAIPQLRARVSVGALFPSRTSLLFDPEADNAGDDGPPPFDYDRIQRAMLASGWLEWALPWAPIWLGADTTAVLAREDRYNLDRAILARVPEREFRSRIYALGHIDRDSPVGMRLHSEITVELAAQHRLTQLPAHESRLGRVARDRSWLGLLRVNWMPLRNLGVELGYFVLDRLAAGEGELPGLLRGTHHRFSTRLALAFDPHVRLTIGVGWDLDDREQPYDQSGMTLTARW